MDHQSSESITRTKMTVQTRRHRQSVDYFEELSREKREVNRQTSHAKRKRQKTGADSEICPE